MKTKIITLLIATASVAHANLIDLTPGGFDPNNPPQVYIDWVNNNYNQNAFGIAYENLNGWVPGFLQPPLFTSTSLGDSTATLSWNLIGTPYSFGWLFVGGPNGLVNMYQVSLDQMLNGNAIITINGEFSISQLGIYGPVAIPTPDNGSTFLLLGFGLAALVGARMALPEMVEKHLSMPRSLREPLPNPLLCEIKEQESIA
jgi:hypothetical protein